MNPSGPTEIQLTVEVAGGNETQRGGIEEMLKSLGDLGVGCLSGPAMHDGNRGGRVPDVAMVLLATERTQWSDQIQLGAGDKPHPTVIALIADHSTDAVRFALRSGADDVLFLPLTHEDLARALVRVMEARRVLRPTRGGIFSFASVSGGTGVSSLVANSALAISLLEEKKAALVDLDLQGGALSVLFDVEPERTITELVDPTITIDSIRMESVLCRLASGLSLLAAPTRIEEAELVSPTAVSSLLAVMKEMFDYVLVDSGHHISEASVAAWEKSNKLIYVVDQSVTAVRAALRFLDLASRLRLGKVEIDFLLNRFSDDSPLTVAEIETSLKHSLLATIPRDDQGFLDAQIEGCGLWEAGARSATREAVAEAVRRICDITPAQEPVSAGRIVSRLLHAVHARAV